MSASSHPIPRIPRGSAVLKRCDLLRPLPIQTLSAQYWTFLSASVFFDLGFGLFFFIFNLYLATLHFDEKSIGLFTSAFTIGGLCATFPAGLLARRLGLRPLLAICFLAAPLAGIFRTFALSQTWQFIASAMLGIAMSGWAVCTPTALARLTQKQNRSLGFSLNFAVGIGAGVFAAFIGGSLPSAITHLFRLPDLAHGMRFTLVLACILIVLGALPLTQPDFLAFHVDTSAPTQHTPSRHTRFLAHFLIAFGVWTAVAGAFAPFAGIYMLQRLHIPLPRVGAIFAASQFVQSMGVLSNPLLNRWLGTRRSIVTITGATTLMLLLISHTSALRPVIVELVLLNALVYMAGPSIYSLLMSHTADRNRSTASAAQSITASIAISAAAATGGLIASRYGYPALFSNLAAIALIAGILFASLTQPSLLEAEQQ